VAFEECDYVTPRPSAKRVQQLHERSPPTLWIGIRERDKRLDTAILIRDPLSMSDVAPEPPPQVSMNARCPGTPNRG
jgi:hypothetical protein